MPECEYKITDIIKSPGEAGAKTKGDKKSVGGTIDVAVGYQNCLSKGPSWALPEGVRDDVIAVCGKDPIGIVDIVKTKGQCKDTVTNKKVDLSYFVNTKPSCGTKENPSTWRDCGLKAGISKDISGLATIFENMFSFGTPVCTEVKMKHCSPGTSAGCTNKKKTGYLTKSDERRAKAYDAEYEINNQEGFQNRTPSFHHEFSMPDDPIIHLYYAATGLLMFYILLRVTTNER